MFGFTLPKVQHVRSSKLTQNAEDGQTDRQTDRQTCAPSDTHLQTKLAKMILQPRTERRTCVSEFNVHHED